MRPSRNVNERLSYKRNKQFGLHIRNKSNTQKSPPHQNYKKSTQHNKGTVTKNRKKLKCSEIGEIEVFKRSAVNHMYTRQRANRQGSVSIPRVTTVDFLIEAGMERKKTDWGYKLELFQNSIFPCLYRQAGIPCSVQW